LRAAALPSESYVAPGVHPEILVPLLPNMNSVINLRWLEHRLHSLDDSDTGGFVPRYVLNQFDSTQPLHLDVREVLRRQLGDRLLPITIRSSPLVAEALAEGMTVIDYAPGSAIAGDYRALADWLRSVSAPRTQVARSSRWSEQ
jgi:cellulose biosynthesis protein BcsQ